MDFNFAVIGKFNLKVVSVLITERLRERIIMQILSFIILNIYLITKFYFINLSLILSIIDWKLIFNQFFNSCGFVALYLFTNCIPTKFALKSWFSLSIVNWRPFRVSPTCFFFSPSIISCNPPYECRTILYLYCKVISKKNLCEKNPDTINN